jgi:hypothetical protein
MGSRHHPVGTDDWTATCETTQVQKRYLQALLMRSFTGKNNVCLGKWILNSLRSLELIKFFLYVKNHSFTWYGKSSMFTGTPPTIRPSRRGRARGVTAPEKLYICDRIFRDIYCYINCTSAALCESNFNWLTNKQKTNELTTLNSELLEMVTVYLLVYKFRAFYGTRMCITPVT